MLNLFFATLVPIFIANLPFGTTSPTPRDCEATYYKQDNKVKDSYVVIFNDGYTLEKHFKFLGRKFEVDDILSGYGADLPPDLFDKVRTDCGVRFVEGDFTRTQDVHSVGNSNKTSSPR
jgi:hypothetical protein